jgi:hypothetical protein
MSGEAFFRGLNPTEKNSRTKIVIVEMPLPLQKVPIKSSM